MSKMRDLKVGKIATLSGRFYAMDRDNNWDRIERTYLAMVKGFAEQEFTNPLEAIESSHQTKIYDEEFIPVVIKGIDEEKSAVIKDNDAVIFFNFRPDRARELTKALVSDKFTGFKREKIKNLFLATLTEYEKGLPVKVAFPSEDITNTLGEVVSNQKLGQVHIAETEKYAHVTFFFNGT